MMFGKRDQTTLTESASGYFIKIAEVLACRTTGVIRKNKSCRRVNESLNLGSDMEKIVLFIRRILCVIYKMFQHLEVAKYW